MLVTPPAVVVDPATNTLPSGCNVTAKALSLTPPKLNVCFPKLLSSVPSVFKRKTTKFIAVGLRSVVVAPEAPHPAPTIFLVRGLHCKRCSIGIISIHPGSCTKLVKTSCIKCDVKSACWSNP